MPITGSHTHGPWTLTKNHWSDPWTATHRDTGQTIETGEHHIERAKDAIDQATTDAPAEQPAPTARYTIQPRRTTATPRGWDVA